MIPSLCNILYPDLSKMWEEKPIEREVFVAMAICG
jgi:hypothetical protein